MYALAKYPDIQAKCHAAIDEYVRERNGSGNGGDTTTASGSVVLPPYVEAVLKESMRRFPVATRGMKR